MIEEVNTTQYVQHYFEKVYTELDHSPESFLRAALEFLEKQSGLLSQPNAMESLVRLAESIPADSPVSSPETAQQRAATVAAPSTTPTTTTDSAAISSLPEEAVVAAAAPVPSVEMQDAAEVDEKKENEEVESKAWRKAFFFSTPKFFAKYIINLTNSPTIFPAAVNSGNGADFPTYSWTQTLQEVIITVPVPAGTKGKMCNVVISRSHLLIGLHSAPSPTLDGDLPYPVKVEDCLWNLIDGKLLEITLTKVDTVQWWRAVVVGQPEIDTTGVEPEASKLSDLDGEMRATVEKMMFDQRQKAMGLPTSEESSKEAAYQKFMAAHPEMDFSGAKFM